MNRLKNAILDNPLASALLVVAVAMLLNGFLLVQVTRQSVSVQEQQRDFMEQWATRVGVIAQWQGPTSLVTHTSVDGREATLGIQEARGPLDVENAWDRTADGLKRLARKQ